MKRKTRTKVKFVCLGNACRSPMAEAIARRIGHGVMEASSAGLTTLGHVEEMTKQTLLKNGYAADGLTSKPVQRLELETTDLVVNMSGRSWDLVFDGVAEVEHWNVEDPYGADAEIYQRIFEDIEKRVAKLTDRLRTGRSVRRMS